MIVTNYSLIELVVIFSSYSRGKNWKFEYFLCIMEVVSKNFLNLWVDCLSYL